MRAIVRHVRAWFRWRNVVALALTTILERLADMNSALSTKIAELKADVDSTRDLVAKQASDLTAVKASLADALAAGTPPTADDIAALDAIHAELHGILGLPVPDPSTPDVSANPAPPTAAV